MRPPEFGLRVCETERPERVGTIVARSRFEKACMVRWDHSGLCSVVRVDRMSPADWSSLLCRVRDRKLQEGEA